MTTKKSGPFIKGSGRFPNLSYFCLAAQLFPQFNPIFAIQHVLSSFFFLIVLTRPFAWTWDWNCCRWAVIRSEHFSAIRIRMMDLNTIFLEKLFKQILHNYFPIQSNWWTYELRWTQNIISSCLLDLCNQIWIFMYLLPIFSRYWRNLHSSTLKWSSSIKLKY